MLTQKFDSAFDAMTVCRARVAALLDCYRPQTPERQAVEGLLAALESLDAALTRAPSGSPCQAVRPS